MKNFQGADFFLGKMCVSFIPYFVSISILLQQHLAHEACKLES